MGRQILNSIALIGCALVLVAVLGSDSAWASTRVALVVGNGGYDPKNAPKLPNPVNDARLMTKSLETSGFEVQLVTDADQAAMKKAIKAFGKRLVEAGGDSVGLFYFAGHGVEDRGQNYLIPLGAEIESEVDFHTDAVLMDWVLARMKKAGNRLNMVILDACRNNPFEGRYRGGSQGLAQMDAPSGSLIAYAAAPRQVASDGEGENSPYTAALAETLVQPGLKIEDVFKRVRVAVEEATNGEQTPWENSSLRGDFYFVSKVKEPPPPEPAPTTVTDLPSAELTQERLAARAYEAAERVNTISGYQLFVEQYPETLYAKLAEEHIRMLEKSVAPPAPSPEELEASLGLDPAEREQIQIGLWAQGFNPGAPDSNFGSRTREAIRTWQASRGLETTGNLDAESRNALLAAVPDLSGPIWLTAQNKPCRVWNPNPEAGESLIWSGGCVDGKASGSGRLVWRGSYGESVYEGEYRDGKKNGRGSQTWAGGQIYEGEWRNGKRHGLGTMTWANGQRYEGEWRDHLPNGQGICIDAEVRDGDMAYAHRYEGSWRDGNRHGDGTATQAIKFNAEKDNGVWVSHTRYVGEFREGNLHGTVRYYRGDNTDAHNDWTHHQGSWRIRYEGEYRDGEAHGKWTFFEKDGVRHQGTWKDGETQGDVDKHRQPSLWLLLQGFRNGPPIVRWATHSEC